MSKKDLDRDKLIRTLGAALVSASQHLDYCGYGDSWERECAGDLPTTVEDAIGEYEEYIK